jgi:hypothetical protein
MSNRCVRDAAEPINETWVASGRITSNNASTELQIPHIAHSDVMRQYGIGRRHHRTQKDCYADAQMKRQHAEQGERCHCEHHGDDTQPKRERPPPVRPDETHEHQQATHNKTPYRVDHGRYPDVAKWHYISTRLVAR